MCPYGLWGGEMTKSLHDASEKKVPVRQKDNKDVFIC